MWPTWVLSAPDGPHIGPINLAITLHWHHNDQDSVSNHQPYGCLLNRLFRRRSKKTSRLCFTGLCAGNSPRPVTSPHKWPVTRKMFPFDDVITRVIILLAQRQPIWLPTSRSYDRVPPDAYTFIGLERNKTQYFISFRFSCRQFRLLLTATKPWCGRGQRTLPVTWMYGLSACSPRARIQPLPRPLWSFWWRNWIYHMRGKKYSGNDCD